MENSAHLCMVMAEVKQTPGRSKRNIWRTNSQEKALFQITLHKL